MNIMRLLIGCMELDIGYEANRRLGTWKLPKIPTGLKAKPQFSFKKHLIFSMICWQRLYEIHLRSLVSLFYILCNVS
jgi:hypothetical protein